MKFLKSYKDSASDKQYKLYDISEIKDKVKNLHLVNFTKNEEITIENLLPDFVIYSNYEKDGLSNFINVSDYYLVSKLIIYKYSDEWYTIQDYSKDDMFLCDGFQGVINCITDNFLPNKSQLKIKESKEENKQYKLITKEELLHKEKSLKELHKNILIDFSGKELRYINNISGIIGKKDKFVYLNLKGRKITLYKLYDDYYCVSYQVNPTKKNIRRNNYDRREIIYQRYLCDGFEGLKNCLQDLYKNVIKESKYEKGDKQYEEYEINDLFKKTKNLQVISFSKKEVDNIKELCPNIMISFFGKNLVDVLDKYNIPIGSIMKYTDEYYLVHKYEEEKTVRYLCDQIQGLVNCIKDNLNVESYELYKENIEEKLYKSIRIDEFDNRIKNLDEEDFTEKEIDLAEKTFLYEKAKIYGLGDQIVIDIYSSSDYTGTYNQRFYIYKYSDEWYFIMSYRKNEFYMCDSFEGVIECLENIKSNFTNK